GGRGGVVGRGREQRPRRPTSLPRPQAAGRGRRRAITLQRGGRREPSGRSLGLPPMTGGALSAVPDFGFAGACLVTWFRPTAFGNRMVHHIAMVMLLEFFVVHSAGFMGVVAA